jgi:hypothetical protein
MDEVEHSGASLLTELSLCCVALVLTMLLFAIAQRFKFGCGFTRHLFHQGSPLEAALLPRKLSPSAVGIYPVTDEATESKLVCPSRKQRRR